MDGMRDGEDGDDSRRRGVLGARRGKVCDVCDV